MLGGAISNYQLIIYILKQVWLCLGVQSRTTNYLYQETILVVLGGAVSNHQLIVYINKQIFFVFGDSISNYHYRVLSLSCHDRKQRRNWMNKYTSVLLKLPPFAQTVLANWLIYLLSALTDGDHSNVLITESRLLYHLYCSNLACYHIGLRFKCI